MLQLLLEHSKLKKGHNYVRKILSVTCPTGMGSLLIVNNWSEFQVNIFSNERDIRNIKVLACRADDRAMTLP